MDSGLLTPASFVNSSRLRLIFKSSHIRPPVVSEMMPDIERMARSISQFRADSTCYALNQDDLVAECFLKLSAILTKNRLRSIRTREEAFRFIKTVFNNHIKGLVARHRKTLKRGCLRVNSDEEESPALSRYPTTVKNVDMTIDDEDHPVHLAVNEDNYSEAQFVRDIAPMLTKTELLVLEEYREPCDRTLIYAQIDASVGRRSSDGLSITISDKHHAAGLGLDLPVLVKILASIRQKINDIRMNDATPSQIAYNQAIIRLEQLLDLKIPASLDKIVVRRLLTLAAVDQFDKIAVNVSARRDLNLVGAKIPEQRAGTLACFGILYQRNSRTCCACGLNTACAAEAANFGLNEVTLDPRLLASKIARVPTIVANNETPPVLTEKDEEISVYLYEHFDIKAAADKWSVRHRDANGLVAVVHFRPDFELEIIQPTDGVTARLSARGSQFFVPNDLTASEVIDIIGTHASSMFCND